MEHKISEPNVCVDVADVLRGLVAMGTITLHSVEHFNFYSFPGIIPGKWMKFIDRAIWNGLLFVFSNKAYAALALLFGFSSYIQDNNQQRRGKDFRLRFTWRMVLLFIIEQLNVALFTGEILTMYAMLGLILPLFYCLGSRSVAIFATLLILQPIDWFKVIYALCNLEYAPGLSLASHYFGIAFDVQENGTLPEMIRMNLWEGQLANLTWVLEYGRILQMPVLFLFGMLVGRKGLFLYSEQNEQYWLKALGMSLLCSFLLYGLDNMLPEFITRDALLIPLQLIIGFLSNLSFMVSPVSGLFITSYRIRDRRSLMCFTLYGKMSLTNYIGQSVTDSLLLYHWGFELGRFLGITYSFFSGTLFVLLQMVFRSWWSGHFKYSPFEGLWERLTWIGDNKRR